MKAMQPDPLPYPRPVPCIDCDEDILLPGGAVIFQNDNDETSDIDQIAAKRAAKRRRIQQHANAYLRGQGISILSAGLRGPFNSSWRNPWVTNDRLRNLANEARTSERAVQNARLDLSASDSLSGLGKSDSIKTPVPATAPLVNPFHRATNLSQPPHSNEKVEGWLRRNSVLYPQNEFSAPLSPTPKTKSSPTQRRQDPKYRWTPTKQLITVNSQDFGAPVQEVHLHSNELSESGRPVKKLKPTPRDSHSRLQNALSSQTDHRALFHKLEAISSPGLAQTLTNPDRAEAEILKIKHYTHEDEASSSSEKQSYQNVLYREIRKDENSTTIRHEHNSLVTPPVSDQEKVDKAPRQSQRTQERSKHVPAVLEIASQMIHTPWKSKLNHVPHASSQPARSTVPSSNKEVRESDGLGRKRMSLPQNATTQSQAHASERNVPALSTAPSNAQSLRLPPSAQPKPDLQTMPSNASSSIRLLEVLSAASVSHGDGKEGPGGEVRDLEPPEQARPTEVNNDMDMESINSEPSQQEEPSEHVKLVDSPARRTNDLPSNNEPGLEDAKEKPSKISEGSSAHDSVARQSPVDPRSHSISSQKRQTTRRSKQDKRTAFAPEMSSMSSAESIKSVLKVRKGDTGTKRSFKSPPPSFSEGKSDLDDPERENSMRSSPVKSWHEERKLSTVHGSSASRKGILKNTNGPPLASRQQAPIAGVGEDDFDLNGAIDELGSFLSTWDAEKDGLKIV